MPQVTNSPLADPLRTIRLPSTPYTRAVGFAVKISIAQGNIERLPIIGDVYSATSIPNKQRVGEFGNHICTDVQQGDGDYFYAYFSPPLSAGLAREAFRTARPTFGNHFWHPTLLKVDVVRMKMPRSVNLGDRIVRGYEYQAIPTFHPAMDTGTLFVLTQFIANDEPTDIIQWDTPQVSPVHFPLPGASRPFSFGECYHPKIDVNVMKEVVDVYDTVGAQVTSEVGNVGPFHFPATDPPYPSPFVLYERPTKLATGAFLIDHMEVVPPNLPAAVKGNN